MITQSFALQLLSWESSVKGPTHVEELGVEQAKLLRDGVAGEQYEPQFSPKCQIYLWYLSRKK